jgi:peptide deformylase
MVLVFHLAATAAVAITFRSVAATDALFIHPHWNCHLQHLRKTKAVLCDRVNINNEPQVEAVSDKQRRQLMRLTITSGLYVADSASAFSHSDSLKIGGIHYSNLRNYYNPNLPSWQGTSLDVVSLQDAAKQISDQHPSNPSLLMGRWPDPVLRRVASPIPLSVFKSADQLTQLQLVALALRNTARKEGAVGLAAQQCGIDASLIFIDGVKQMQYESSFGPSVPGEGKGKRSNHGIFLVNPRIIKRSPESEMLVWTEECLVLPPSFRASLLRDASVTIEYETLDLGVGDYGITKQITLRGELARCAQHEMDHDRGVLIVDHVGLDELLTVGDDDFMASIENADGLHQARMQHAYARIVSESVLLPSREKFVPLAYESSHGLRFRVTELDHTYKYNASKQKILPRLVEPANAVVEDTMTNAQPKITKFNQRLKLK